PTRVVLYPHGVRVRSHRFATFFVILVSLHFAYPRHDHRSTLHFLATRRSSDLNGSGPGHHAAGSQHDRRSQSDKHVSSGSGSYTDRTSTRLNSSHEWISYAVLCLEKKSRKPRSNARPSHTAPRRGRGDTNTLPA